MGNESEILWLRSNLVSELIVRTIIRLLQDKILLVWLRSYRDGQVSFYYRITIT